VQRVDEVLALVEQPLQRRRERKSFDQVVARLAQPQLLHHHNKRLRGLTLDCLEQVVRICQLENNAKGAEEPASPGEGGAATKAIMSGDPDKDETRRERHDEEDDEDDEARDNADDEDDEEADDEGDGPAGKSGEPLSDEVERLGIWCTAPGEMPRLIREKDWASTPLGPIAQWPNTLKIALAICLFTRFPFVRPVALVGKRGRHSHTTHDHQHTGDLLGSRVQNALQRRLPIDHGQQASAILWCVPDVSSMTQRRC
jgi:hypothetical protein